MPYTLVISLDGKLLFSHAGMPKPLAEKWGRDFLDAVRESSRSRYHAEVVEEIDRLPTPDEAATHFHAQEDCLPRRETPRPKTVRAMATA